MAQLFHLLALQKNVADLWPFRSDLLKSRAILLQLAAHRRIYPLV